MLFLLNYLESIRFYWENKNKGLSFPKVKIQAGIDICHINMFRFFFPVKNNNPIRVFDFVQIDAFIRAIFELKQDKPGIFYFHHFDLRPVVF